MVRKYWNKLEPMFEKKILIKLKHVNLKNIKETLLY